MSSTIYSNKITFCLSCFINFIAADKEKVPTKYTEITYDEIYLKNLKVMDLTATTMCKENNMPIYVFDMDTVGNLKKVMLGEKIGTLVRN